MSNGPTTFTETIDDLGSGEVSQKLNDCLAQVVEAVSSTNKAGSVTLVLSIRPEGGLAIASATVKGKMPEETLRGKVYFFGKNGSMLWEDPKQLPMREVLAPVPLRPAEKESGNQ